MFIIILVSGITQSFIRQNRLLNSRCKQTKHYFCSCHLINNRPKLSSKIRFFATVYLKKCVNRLFTAKCRSLSIYVLESKLSSKPKPPSNPIILSEILRILGVYSVNTRKNCRSVNPHTPHCAQLTTDFATSSVLKLAIRAIPKPNQLQKPFGRNKTPVEFRTLMHRIAASWCTAPKHSVNQPVIDQFCLPTRSFYLPIRK